jgi:hypothetical protein
MGAEGDLILDVVWSGAQMLYFKFKNAGRAKAFTAMANAHNMQFWAKGRDYDGCLTGTMPSQQAGTSQKRMSMKAKGARRLFGESQLASRLCNFRTNTWRGDWQTNCNIMEGPWKGHTMTTFDTLWFDFGATDQEGEYTSVFSHCAGDLPHMIITPTGFLSALKRADETQFMGLHSHKVKYESDAFNHAWRVVADDERAAYAIISQNMMDYLLEHNDEKWHIEMAAGGIMISTIYTLNQAKIEQAMDFLAGLIEHIDADLLQPTGQG